MALITIHPIQIDEDVARAVADNTDRSVERIAGAITWGADEHVLVAVAAIGWVLTRGADEPLRRLGTHFLSCSIATAIAPHIMKNVVDQERPDRLTVKGHLRGVPLSGKATDAFPSGHALHIGALASAATLLPATIRNVVWVAGAVIVTTRILLLAHWLTDVAVGLALGAGIERGMRYVTKPRSLSE